jgi:hypothetical protein
MRNAKELLEELAQRALTPDELAEVARRLEGKEGDQYDWLLILGRAEATRYRALVERFLESPDDPMLARLALQVLCRYWDLGASYKDVLMRFARGVPWDEDDDVRLMAIDCLGEVLRVGPDRQPLAYLFQLFESEEERQIVRETAYSAMARAMGTPTAKLPPAGRHFDLSKDIDHAVIDAVMERVQQKD